MVLILDDLQWADASTVLLLSHMLQDPEPVKLLVVATMRETAEERGDELPDLLARLRRQPSLRADRARAAWTPTRPRRWCRAREGRRSATSSSRRLHADTDGNPFFIEEMLRAGVRRSACPRASRR